MASEVKPLTENTWELVLSNVTFEGQVHILDTDPDPTPTNYLVALVDTGSSAPAGDFEGGIPFESFSPANSVSSDYYVKAVGADGKVIILT